MRTKTQVTCLDVKREADVSIDRLSTLEFPMDLYIENIRRDSEDAALITYTLKTTSNPPLVSFTISGILHLNGDKTDVDRAITPPDNGPPKIWQQIYQENTQLLVMLASIINVPFPTPDVEVEATAV